MKNSKRNTKDDFFGSINITMNPALNTASRKGTEKKLIEAKKILAKVKLHESALTKNNIAETVIGLWF